MVEARRGASWCVARVDNVNDDGTYDLVFLDDQGSDNGDEEDGVSPLLIRLRAAAAAAAVPAAAVQQAAQAAAAAPAAVGTKRKAEEVASAEAPATALVPAQHDKKQATLLGFFAKRDQTP